MIAKTIQANFRLSQDIIKKLRLLLPRGEQSRFVEEAIKKELKRREFLSVLETSFNAWGKRKDLGTTESFIRKMRKGRNLKGISK